MSKSTIYKPRYTANGSKLVPEGYGEYYSLVKGLRADAEQRRQMMFTHLLESSRALVADLSLDYCPVCLRPIGNADWTA